MTLKKHRKWFWLLLLPFIYLLYRYPIEHFFAKRTIEAYIAKQDIDPELITSLSIKPDWHLGGYYGDVTYADDPDRIYEFNHFFIDFRSETPFEFNHISLTVYNTRHGEMAATESSQLAIHPPINNGDWVSFGFWPSESSTLKLK